MDQSTVALLSGAVGAVIGSASSIAVILIQAHYQNKRDRSKLAIELALGEMKMHLDTLTETKTSGKLDPTASFIHFYLELMKHVDAGSLTPDSIKAILEKNQAITKAVREFNKRIERDSH